MKPFIVISCLVLAAMAKPQGYSYNAPPALSAPSVAALSVALLPPHSSSHISSAPSYSHGVVSSHGSLGLSSHSSGGSLSLGSSYSVAPSSTYSVGPSSAYSVGSSSAYSVGPSSAYSVGPSSSYNSFSSAPSASTLLAPAPVLAPPAPLPATTFVPSLPVQSSNTLIQKHIYVHVPPPEEEERAPILQLQPQSRQKHYKIIFIKAPSQPSVSKQLLQAQLAQLEPPQEKTLVYVLVKKPDTIEDIQQNIPRVPLSQPSKPEVYFIKYKAQKEQQPQFAPAPIASAPIPLSAPSFVQSGVSSGAVDLALSGLSGQQTTTTVLSHASDSSSAAVAAAAAAATSSSSVESSSSDTSSHLSSGASDADIASITTVIQPRKPAAEYGPPH